jgi:hypothetical protein
MANVDDGELVRAWSLVDTYKDMWDYMVSDADVNIQTVDARGLHDMAEGGRFSFIVSSVPRHAVCLAHAGLIQTPHTFVHQDVRIMNRSVLGDSYDNTIIYDGTPQRSWYRTSRINGVGSTEWGESAPKDLMQTDPVFTVSKPLRHDCDCHHNHKVVFVGRFGTWTKGELVHHAFEKTLKAVKDAL